MRYLPLVWAGLVRKPLRTILTLLSAAAAFMLFGLTLGLNASVRHTIDIARMDCIYVGARWMESLRFDVAPFGIKTMAVEPGFFRTELLVEGASTKWPTLKVEDYAERTAQTISAWSGMNGSQGGDPAKLAAAMVTL